MGDRLVPEDVIALRLKHRHAADAVEVFSTVASLSAA